MQTNMFQRIFLTIALLVLAGLWILQLTLAWPGDPTVNVPICTASNEQEYPAIVSDGFGGAIITWTDRRSDNGDIYSQRVDASGAVQWTANGVAVCTASDIQWSPTIVSDGFGGAIITWHDRRSSNGDIYAQRVSASGAVQWTPNGVAICTASDVQDYPTIVSDGFGGAIITWFDYRSGTNHDIYAQRVFNDGSLPVILSSFTAAASDGKVMLLWRTESEVNNIGFSIYRSLSEEGPFEKIGWIDGAGNSAMLRDYQFTDKTAQHGRTYFYYIENIDIEGLHGKSKIIKITLPEKQLIVIPSQTALFQNFHSDYHNGRKCLPILNSTSWGQMIQTLSKR